MSEILNKLLDTLRDLWSGRKLRLAALALAVAVVLFIGVRACSNGADSVSVAPSGAATEAVPTASTQEIATEVEETNADNTAETTPANTEN